MERREDTIRVSIPELVEAVYGVAINRHPGDAPSVVATAIGQSRSQLRREVEQAIENLELTVGVYAAEHTPFDLGEATHVLVVRATGHPGLPARHEPTALSLACDLATTFDGRLFDARTMHEISRSHAQSIVARSNDSIELSDWMDIASLGVGSSATITTVGLARFGLPELCTVGVPAQLSAEWGAVTHEVAMAMLAWCTDEVAADRRVLNVPTEIRLGGYPVAVSSPRPGTLRLSGSTTAETNAQPGEFGRLREYRLDS